MRNKEQEMLELLQHPGFKEWVIHPTEEHNLYWQKWMEKHPEQQETVSKAREFILRMRFKDQALSASAKEALLDNIIADPKNKLVAYPKSVYPWQWLKVAAVLALIFTFSYFAYRIPYAHTSPTPLAAKNITKANPSGRKSQIILPDGTKVHLNAESKLIYPEEFSDSARVVQLVGEAFFEVAEDTRRPFSVKAKNVTTTALGTRFNVNGYPETGQVHIALVSGKLRIEKDTLHSQSYLLHPGEKIMFGQKAGYGKITPFDDLHEIGWKDGILIFEDASFSEFISKLERWYGVKFLVQGTPHQTWQIEGKFDNESLEEILKGVSFTHNIQYEINGQQIKITY